MKLFTKIKLKLEGVIKSVNLDWRVVAIELNEDLLEERKRRFVFEQENYNLKQELPTSTKKTLISRLDCKEKCRCTLYRFMSRMLKLETRISV